MFRHKKQTGGRGQFAEVHLRVAPLPRGGNFEFVDEVVGGTIPRQFIPAVEKGIRETLREGRPRRLSVHRRPGDRPLRQVPRRRQRRALVQARLEPGVQARGRERVPDPPRAHPGGGDRGADALHGRHLRRPEQPSRAHPGHDPGGRHGAHPGRGAALRDDAVQHRARGPSPRARATTRSSSRTTSPCRRTSRRT